MRTIVAVLALGALSGCFRDLKLIRLQADGSGALVHTRLMKSWAMEQARKNGVDDHTEGKARARVAELGEGVTFRTAEKLKEGDWEGLRATYDFKDVAKLKLDKDEKFTLARHPDGRHLLTAVTRFSPSPKSEGKDALDLTEDQKRALLAGLRMSVTVEVPGKVVRCSSPHVVGSTLTLLEFDLDLLLAEEDRLKREAAVEPATLEEARKVIHALRTLEAYRNPGQDPERWRKAAHGLKGFKHALEPEVTLEFAP